MLRLTQGEKPILRRRLIGLLGERISVEEGGVLAREPKLPKTAIEGLKGKNVDFALMLLAGARNVCDDC